MNTGRYESDGYVFVMAKDHPNANRDGFIREHVLVMERTLGHVINSKTHAVHHINEDRRDNRPENLQCLTPREHKRVHSGWRIVDGTWYKTCRGCRVEHEATSEHFYERKTGILSYKCRKCTQEAVAARKDDVIDVRNCERCSKSFEVRAAYGKQRFCGYSCSSKYIQSQWR